LVVGLAAWLVAFAVHTAEPAGYDFIALYATARLVATGHGGEVTDPAAQFAMEHAILSERTVFLFDPNVPALALLMAPLGALPYTPAYAAMLTLRVAAPLVAVAALSLAVAGVDGLARYPLLVSLAAEQLRPGELGLPALARRGLGPDAVLNAALTLATAAIAAVVIVRRSRDVSSQT